MMKVFWDDCGRGILPEDARAVDLAEAGLIWSDEVRAVEGNFLGLVDDADRTIQFYYDGGIPDDVEDASHLPAVLLDFPIVDRGGSYSRRVTIGEVHGLIAAAFATGADHRRFGALDFTPW